MRTRADDRAAEQGCYFDEVAAQRAINFIETYLTIGKGIFAGKPFVLLPWQRQIISDVFGWMRADGTRRYRTVYLQVGRQNGKSQLASAVATYLLLADGEEQPIVCWAAVDRSQATIGYRELEYYARNNQRLRNALHVRPSLKEIEYPKRSGLFKALSADAPNKQGWSYHGVILDELHLHTSPAMYESLQFGTRARRQPLIFITTTSGARRDSYCYQMYRYAKAILDGSQTDISFYPAIFEAEENCALDDESQWHAANPSLASGIQSLEVFQEDAQAAKFSTVEEVKFRRYRLGQWINAATTFVNADAWDRCIVRDWPDLAGQRMTLALDLASTTDLCAMAGIVVQGGRYWVHSWAWCPEETIRKRAEGNGYRYDTFLREGSLTASPGNACDYRLIRDKIAALRQRFNITEVVLDKWNALHLATELQEDGLTVWSMPQSTGYLNDPTKQLEKLVLEKTLAVQPYELLRWQVGNLQVEADSNGNVKPSKKRSAEKIDNLCAIIFALTRAAAPIIDPMRPVRLPYADRDIFYV